MVTPRERNEILSHFKAQGVNNLAVLSGDIHTFCAGDLTTTGTSAGEPVAVELVGGSITSTGIPGDLGIPGSSVLVSFRVDRGTPKLIRTRAPGTRLRAGTRNCRCSAPAATG